MQPYKYQREDIEFMKRGNNVFNCNSVGLGKTVESIVLAKELGASKILIVSPKTLMYQWKEEISAWDRGAKCLVIDGTKNNRHKLLGMEAKYYIVNYAMLRRGRNKMFEYKELFIHREYKTKPFIWDIVFFDESQKLKNRNSEQTYGSKKIAAKKKVLLSATPILNTPDELYAQLNILYPKKYSSYWQFVDRYCEQEKVWGASTDISRVIGWKKGMNLVLKRELEGIMFRREKEDVLNDLPDKTYKEYKIRMESKQYKAYKELEKNYVTKTIDDILQVEGELDKLIRLRQIALDPAIVNIKGDSAKNKALIDILEGIDGQVVIFSWFKSYVKIVQKLLESKGYTVSSVHGDKTSKERADEIKKFKDNKNQVFIATYATATEGLNLQNASNMVLLDKPFSSMIQEQAEGRIYRDGQKNNCLIISMIIEDSIEEDIEQTLKDKTKEISKFMSIKSILKYFKNRLDK